MSTATALVRRLGMFDATMLVMGGIVGAGIFVNPAEVARHVETPGWIVGVWVIGGFIALAASFVYAELAARRPEVGGQYAYLRDAWGPMPAFLYGWALLLVIQSGGMAAVAITFARYFNELTGLAVPDSLIGVSALALLTIVNCFGVRSGSNVQSALMVLKIGAIAMLVVVGLWFAPGHPPQPHGQATPMGASLSAIGAALTPVMFAYGGWQTASFCAGEMRDPRRDLARGLLLGVAGVILLYCAVAFVCVYALGPVGLAQSKTPASDVMRLALGQRGATLIALGIAVSTLGFLSQGMLTTPRVYFAMAEDGLFFRGVARVHPVTRVPIVAIVLQGAAAAVIALSGTYGQILSYVVSVDFIFFGLTGAALFVFRRRDREQDVPFRAPFHPLTSGLFVAACIVVVIATVWNNPVNSLIGYAILAAGVPACLYWQRKNRGPAPPMTGPRTMQSDYMHWAKFKEPVRFPLTGSEPPHFRMDSLGWTIADLDLDGASHPRYVQLRERIAARYGVTVDQVVAADGTSMANFLAMATLISPGDEVLIEHPTYEPLLGVASFLGAQIRRFERKPAGGFRLDPDIVRESASGRTRLIVLTNLHNPSGALAEEDELRAVGALGTRVLIDEVYLDAASRRSAVHLGPQFVVTNSLTKVYGLSGLRCGWILADPELAERMWRLNDLFGVNQAHPAERLACIAFDHLDDVLGETPKMLARNRALFNAFIAHRGDLDGAPAEHGLTAFPRWSGGDTQRLDDHLREHHDAAIVPGSWFEMPDHFRLGFGYPSDQFEEALTRLGTALDELG